MKQLLFGCFLLLAHCCIGQTTTSRNAVYLEGGGNGLFGSVNYERQLGRQPGLGLRAGVGVYEEFGVQLTLPTGIYYLLLLGSDRSLLDAGLGVTFALDNSRLVLGRNDGYSFGFTNFVPSLGYRRHAANNWMWRASLTPVINRYATTPWLGFSFGKRF